MIVWGNFGAQQATFAPGSPTTWGTLHRWLSALGLPANAGLAAADRKDMALTRAECAQHLWRVLQLTGEWFPASTAGNDQDHNSMPDRLEPKS
jgi:hypothetical protein